MIENPTDGDRFRAMYALKQITWFFGPVHTLLTAALTVELVKHPEINPVALLLAIMAFSYLVSLPIQFLNLERNHNGNDPFAILFHSKANERKMGPGWRFAATAAGSLVGLFDGLVNPFNLLPPVIGSLKSPELLPASIMVGNVLGFAYMFAVNGAIATGNMDALVEASMKSRLYCKDTLVQSFDGIQNLYQLAAVW